MKVAVIFIGTGKYLNFLPKYWEKVESNFLPDVEKTIFAFTDGELSDVPGNIIVVKQEHLEWPFITLLRFGIINKMKEELLKYDQLVFMDADTVVYDTVTVEEFFSDKPFFGVHHPCHFLGFPPHNKLPGAFETDARSQGSIDLDQYSPKVYYQGCLWGGKIPEVFELIDLIDQRTQVDIKNDTIPVWHDESHINRFFIENEDRVHLLGPEYAYPEVFESSCTFDPKIVHLEKDNSKYQV